MKPILFSTEMVQAILTGRKTQTRRVVKAPVLSNVKTPDSISIDGNKFVFRWNGPETIGGFDTKPPYNVGDVLWVREKWRSVDFEYRDCMWSASIQYADGEKGPRVFWYDNSDVGIPDNCIYNKTGWRPSIHMPKEAARIFLRVKDVRVERVQDISAADAVREGIARGWGLNNVECFAGGCYNGDFDKSCALCDVPVEGFRELWNTLNAKRGYGWDSNPWVWVIEFEKCDPE